MEKFWDSWWSSILFVVAAMLAFMGGLFVGTHQLANKGYEPETYRIASVICEETELTPWAVGTCQWEAYEKFYGTDAAIAAWAEGRQEEVQP